MTLALPGMFVGQFRSSGLAINPSAATPPPAFADFSTRHCARRPADHPHPGISRRPYSSMSCPVSFLCWASKYWDLSNKRALNAVMSSCMGSALHRHARQHVDLGRRSPIAARVRPNSAGGLQLREPAFVLGQRFSSLFRVKQVIGVFEVGGSLISVGSGTSLLALVWAVRFSRRSWPSSSPRPVPHHF